MKYEGTIIRKNGKIIKFPTEWHRAKYETYIEDKKFDNLMDSEEYKKEVEAAKKRNKGV